MIQLLHTCKKFYADSWSHSLFLKHLVQSYADESGLLHSQFAKLFCASKQIECLFQNL